MTTETTPSERTLILVRHAKAEHGQGKPDHDRDLTSRGRSDARAVGVWLSDPSRAFILDVVLCSTSERTRQTLAGIADGGASAMDARFEEGIYNGGAAALLDLLRELPDSARTVLMIGHAPGIPVLATALAHEQSSRDAIDLLSGGFPTSGVAVLGFAGPWTALGPESAYLRTLVVPRG